MNLVAKTLSDTKHNNGRVSMLVWQLGEVVTHIKLEINLKEETCYAISNTFSRINLMVKDWCGAIIQI